MKAHKAKDEFFTHCNKFMADDVAISKKWKRVTCVKCIVTTFTKRRDMNGKWVWVPVKKEAKK